MGSNPGTIYWMDMTFFHIDLLLKLYCLLKKTKNKRKRGDYFCSLKVTSSQKCPLSCCKDRANSSSDPIEAGSSLGGR